MTRFARAKGSKSSNERLPNDATPWHVMKQQLEFSLDKSQAGPETKTKSAKQLLKEKDDHYYATSLGNTNNDWAEFETSKDKKNTLKSGKVEKKTKDQSKKIKTVLKKTVEKEDLINNKAEDLSKSSKNCEKLKVKEKQVDQQNDSTPVESEPNQFKDKKRKKKRNSESKLINDNKKSKNKEVDTKNSSENKIEENIGEPIDKLSKRQKRNQKKQNQKSNDESENVNKAPFNAEGNDWNTSVNFDRRRKFDNNQNGKSMNNTSRNMHTNRQSNSNLNQHNFNRFGNNVPKKYQQKTAKIRDDREHQRRKPDNNSSMKVTINGMDVEIVKYDGFPVKKEDAARLAELRKEMLFKGIPRSEVDAAMKLERRKCEKALARIRKQVCFHCRKAGHNLSDCPELGEEEAGTGICFKCGSTEHTHFECKVTKSDDYRYAKCFICREQGHISKQCPDNPKGLYPDGGSCKICGDVTHLKKDCPDLVKEKEETAITLDTITDKNLESLDDDRTRIKPETKPNKKIVKF